MSYAEKLRAYLDNLLGPIEPRFEQDINSIFEAVVEDDCSILVRNNSVKQKNSIIGLMLNNNYNINLSLFILIPNLFRLCFIQEKITVPTFCPIFIYRSDKMLFLPLTLTKKYIQAFLYFGYSSDIYKYPYPYHPNKTLVQDKINDFIKKKRNLTNSSFTDVYYFVSQIYSSDSLLIQFNNFYRDIMKSKNLAANEKIECNKYISWFYTTECSCLNGNLNDTFSITRTKPAIIPQTDLVTLNNAISSFPTGATDNIALQKSSFISNTYSKNDLTTYGVAPTIELVKDKVYTLIDILFLAEEVLQDVQIEISYAFLSKCYSKKDYMNPELLPELDNYYKNYYYNTLNVISMNP